MDTPWQVFSLTDWQWWVAAGWFGVAVIISWLLPGVVLFRLLARNHTPRLPVYFQLTASLVIGLVAWTAQAYIFGWLQMRTATALYLIVMWYLWYQRFPAAQLRSNLDSLWSRLRQESKRLPKWAWLLIITASVVQLLPVFTSGLRYSEGIGYIGINFRDSLMHTSFIGQMVVEFPPHQPGAADLFITNYHYWSDLAIAELVRVWHLPISQVFFQLQPVVLIIASGLLGYYLIRVWGGSRLGGLSWWFWGFLASDAGWLFTLIWQGKFNWDIAALDNGPTQLINMPHVYAKVIFLTALIFLSFWLKQRRWPWLLAAMLLGASLFGFKVYFGLAWCLIWGLVWLGSLVRSKGKQLVAANWQPAVISIMGAVVTLAVYLPVNRAAGGLTFVPIAWPKLFLAAGQLDWVDWWLRLQTYEAADNWPMVILLAVLASGIFIVAMEGTRLLGWLGLALFWPKNRLLFTALLTTMTIFHLLGLLTLQNSGSGIYNVYNFFSVSLVMLSLGMCLGTDFFRGRFQKFLLPMALAVILLSLPRTIFEVQYWLGRTADRHFSALITPEEEALLSWLRHQTPPEAIVQSHPNNTLDQNVSYVGFFSNRLTYQSGTDLMKTHDQPVDDRIDHLTTLFQSEVEAVYLYEELRKLGISYLYLQAQPDQTLPVFQPDEQYFQSVFSNSAGQIIKLP